MNKGIIKEYFPEWGWGKTNPPVLPSLVHEIICDFILILLKDRKRNWAVMEVNAFSVNRVYKEKINESEAEALADKLNEKSGDWKGYYHYEMPVLPKDY